MTQQSQALDIEALAQEIRRVDGNHDLGAGQLAEALAPYLAALGGTPAKQREAEAVRTEAQFLLDRLSEYDPTEEGSYRDFFGHVEPSMARLRILLTEAALSQHPAPAEVDGPNYYTKGKDASWFEALPDAEFAWQAEKAAMDLADMDTGVLEEYIPFVAIISEGAERVKRLAALSQAQVKLTKLPVEFRVLAHGNWLHFTDEQMAQESADMHGVDYQGLYVRDGSPASPVPAKADGGVTDGMVSVPKRFCIDATAIANLVFQCGCSDDNTEFVDAIAWVGEIEGDADEPVVYGLHAYSTEYPEDGSVTLAEFPARLALQQDQRS